MTRELDIKLVCVGDANTGKTTFLRHWETGEAPLHLSTTIQMEFHRREMSIAVPPPAYFEEGIQGVKTEGKATVETSATITTSGVKNGFGCESSTVFQEMTLMGHGDDKKKNGWRSPGLSLGLHRRRYQKSDSPFSIVPVSSSSGNQNSSNNAILHNPFGADYIITPPSIPLFYVPSASGSSVHRKEHATCNHHGGDVDNEDYNDNDNDNDNDDGTGGESKGRWPLIRAPAIVKVWDIQGQESTKKMTRIFYAGSIAVLIFCEISSSIDSLTNALLWKSDVEQKIFISKQKPPHGGLFVDPHQKVTQKKEKTVESENPPCWLVVNKYDLLASLPSPPSWASRAALDELCVRHGFAGWSYAAGRWGVNVEAIIQAVIAAAVARFPQQVCGNWGLKKNINDNSSGSGGGGGDTEILRTRRRLSQRRRNGCCSK